MSKHILQIIGVVLVASVWMWFTSSFNRPDNSIERTSTGQFELAKQAVAQKDYQNAVLILSNVIEAEPGHCEAYFQRGIAYLAISHSENALEDFNRDIELQPGRASSFNNRSVIWKSKGELQLSLADSDEAIKLAPVNVPFRHNRADTCFKTGDIQKGLVDLYTALELARNNPYTYHYLAWFYAACPDERYRDPKLAIEYAINSCENSDWTLGFMISTLAVAHAADGQFSEAIEYEHQARELYDPSEMKLWVDRLQMFKDGQPLIDDSIHVREDDPGPMKIEIPIIQGGVQV